MRCPLPHLRSLSLSAKRLTDVPFNIGSSYDSQKLLEEVRVNPTGWGGLYSEILRGVPMLPSNKKAVEGKKDEL
jgi:hypothetical protein